MSSNGPRSSSPSTVPPSDPPGPALTPFGFWSIFTLAWVAYGGLYLSVAIFEGLDLPTSLELAVGSALAPGLPAVAVALRRRDLLRPERSLGRTVGLHVVVGVLYTVTAVLMAALIVSSAAMQVEGNWSESPSATLLARALNGVFLYMILLGFLMWTESMDRVQKSRAAVAREAVLRAQAEAKALRAQFNPHFVFNTLHSLMLLVRADPPAAERAIENVASLIRYATVLQRQGVDAVPLSQELTILRRYLDLEKLRLAERLQVEWEMEPDLDGVGVPALSLQTLVENAIKHGLSPRPQGGSLRIGATREGEDLVLTVEDNGEGAEEAAVAGAEGRGLDLLRRRLEAIYGGTASLEWRTAAGEGFSVTLRIPAEPAEALDGMGWLEDPS